MNDTFHSTPDKEIDSQQRLNSILDIGKSLASVGIDPNQRISLNQENPTSENTDSPKRLRFNSSTITFNGKGVSLTPREMQILQVFQAEEGAQITQERLAHRMDIDEHSIAQLINRLRKKLEDDPRRPVFFVTNRKEGIRAGGFVYRSPKRVARELANQTSKT